MKGFDYRADKQVREAKLDGKKGYTYSQYLTWNDEKRYELIDGVVYQMAPAPSRRHQQVLAALYVQFYNYLIDQECEVYFAPFEVRLPGEREEEQTISTVVQPDLVVVCAQDKLDEAGCKGAPDLVLEVVSASSRGRDRQLKKDLYQKHGVREYWLVDYLQNKIEVYLLNEEQRYGKPVLYNQQQQVVVSIFADLKIDLALVFP